MNRDVILETSTYQHRIALEIHKRMYSSFVKFYDLDDASFGEIPDCD